MVLATTGIVIGIGGALWPTHFLKSFLFEVKVLDRTAFIATLLLSVAIALLAVWFPA